MAVTTPDVFAVMPTRAVRRWCLPRAIRYWQAQTYPHLTLLVVDDADGGVSDLVPRDDPRIQYAKSGAATVGDKYNAGLSMAPHDSMVMIAGDDDRVAPEFVSVLVETARSHNVEICGLTAMLAYRYSDRQAFVYGHPLPSDLIACRTRRKRRARVKGRHAGVIRQRVKKAPYAYLIGGGMLFSHRLWRLCHFPAMKSGCDSVFVRTLLETGVPYVAIDDMPWLYVCAAHPGNTGNGLNKHAHETVWAPIGYDLRKVLGADAAGFLDVGPP